MARPTGVSHNLFWYFEDEQKEWSHLKADLRKRAEKLIRSRVKAFLTDFAKWNAKFYKSAFELVDWDQARKDFEKTVASKHFLGGGVSGVGNGVGHPPEHSPEDESILTIDLRSGREAVVETIRERGVPEYYEYVVRQVGEQWRIAGVQTFFSDKNEVVKADADIKRLARQRRKSIKAKEFPEDLHRLFVGPARLNTRFGVTKTKIVRVGTIETPSGFLACDDPGSWQCGVSVFELEVPKGKHEIELVLGNNPEIVGAARVVFNRKTGGTYADATRRLAEKQPGAKTHLISVDGGMVGLVDAAAVIALSRRERERLYGKVVEAKGESRRRRAEFIALDNGPEMVAIDSGCGDGGYFAFWQLDKAGRPLSLVLDFADLALPRWESITVAFNLRDGKGTLSNGPLRAHGANVRFERESDRQLLIVRCSRETKVKILNAGDQTIFDSEGYGCSVCGDETTYHLHQRFPRNLRGKLEVQIYRGDRYEFV